MKKHWTQRSISDYLFRIATDFVMQLENKMDEDNISRDKYSKRLKVSKGRVSQIFNNPGNISIKKLIEYAKALGLKVAIVAYDDGDSENRKGLVNSEIFKICWERMNRPRDFWAIQDQEELRVISAKTTASNTTDIVKINNLGFSMFYGPQAVEVREGLGMSFQMNRIKSFASPLPDVIQELGEFEDCVYHHS